MELRGLIDSAPDSYPVELFGSTLAREFEPLASASSQFNYRFEIGDGRYERFSGLRSIDDYLELIPKAAHAGGSLPQSPLSLPAAFDYLDLLFKSDPRWDGEHFLQLADVTTPAQLIVPPTSVAEYEQRLSAVWNMLARFHVPEGADETYNKNGWKDPADRKPLNNLVVWLQENDLDTDQTKRAIEVIRLVGQLRQEAQHNNTETRARAQKARDKLGLPSMVADYEAAWQQILAELSSAFMAISTAVRAEEAD